MPVDTLAQDLDAAYAARDWPRMTATAVAGLLHEPGRPEAWMMRSVAAAQAGDLDQARKGFGRTAAILPQWPDAWANLGRTETAARSVRAFRRALALAPQMVGLLSPLGLVLLGIADGSGAARLLRRAQGFDPDACEICVNLGLALASQEDDGAAGWLAAAVALAPQEFAAHLNLGLQLLAVGDIDASRDAARRARALQPASVEAIRLEAALLRASARPGDAARLLESIGSATPDDAAVAVQLAVARLDQRRLEAAYEALAGAYRRDPLRLAYIREVLSASPTGELWFQVEKLQQRLRL